MFVNARMDSDSESVPEHVVRLQHLRDRFADCSGTLYGDSINNLFHLRDFGRGKKHTGGYNQKPGEVTLIHWLWDKWTIWTDNLSIKWFIDGQ